MFQVSSTLPSSTLRRGTVVGEITYQNANGKTLAPGWAMSDGSFRVETSFDKALNLANLLSLTKGRPAQGIIQAARGSYLITGLTGLTADPASRNIASAFDHHLSGMTTGWLRKTNWQVSSVSATTTNPLFPRLFAVVDRDTWVDLRKGGSHRPSPLPGSKRA